MGGAAGAAEAEAPVTPRRRGAARVRTPTLIQMEAVECGAAALGIILGYFGRVVPLEELRVECGVSRDGSKASNMVKAAAHYGLVARGYKREPEAILDLPLPLIVFWNFNHFLVVEGFRHTGDPRTSRVFLNDPASGPRTVDWEEFDKGFTGVLLVFEKGPDFKPGGHKRGILGALQKRFAGLELPMLYLILVGLFLVIPGLVLPTFSRLFIDDYLMRGMKDIVIPLLVGLGLTAVLQAGLTWLQSYYLLRLQTKLAVKESGGFFWHVLRLPLEFFTQRYGGEIGGRVAINDQVAMLLSGRLAEAAIGILTVGFYVFLMVQYSTLLTLIGLFFAVLNMVVLRYVSRLRVDLSSRMIMEAGKLSGVAMGGLQNIETLKSSGGESDFFSQWAGYQAKVVNSQQQLARLTQPLAVVPTLLTALNTSCMLGVGGYLIITSTDFSVGMLVAFQSLMGSFMAPFATLVNLGGSIQELQGDMNRLDDVFSYGTDPYVTRAESAADEIGDRIIQMHGAIEIKGLVFGYSKLAPPLIENFALRARPGQRIAIVGASGSGKSTVARLVCGLYEPWHGEILFDGKPRESYPRSIFAASVALVDQDIFLFAGTVRENLTMWDTTVPTENIIAAARDACIHDDIAARGGGYDSEVEEMGSNFSGGQRQRLEIARALVNRPKLLVLDEATSALDPHTEKLIDDNLRRRGCTCLIIAHRLSTIRDCDEIIVLQQGRIVQRGTHDELMADPRGAYARLVRFY